ncbi:MAG: hypothetical protein HND55_02130 [Pseudomonadota bacterium]|nr:MAG: hypothetical protein HND55_02130 [Pseudomonadota bacterium]
MTMHKTIVRLFVNACLVVMATMPAQAGQVRTDSSEFHRASELLESAPLIDGHSDVPWQVRKRFVGRVDAPGFAGGNSLRVWIGSARSLE